MGAGISVLLLFGVVGCGGGLWGDTQSDFPVQHLTGERTSSEGFPGVWSVADQELVADFLAGDDRGAVREVLATQYGGVAVFDHGVAMVALNPEEETWSFQVEDAPVVAGITPNGQNVLLSYGAHGESDYTRWLVMSAKDGSLRHELDALDGDVLPARLDLVTDDQVVVLDGDDVLTGFSFMGGEKLWERSAGEWCPGRGVGSVDAVTNPFSVFVSYDCSGDDRVGLASLSGSEGNERWVQEWWGEERPAVSFMGSPLNPPGSEGDLVEAVVRGEVFSSYELIKGEDGSAWNQSVLWGRLDLFDEHIGEPQSDVQDAPGAVLLFGHDADIQKSFLVQSARFLLDEGVIDADDPRVSDLFVDDGQGSSWLPWTADEWGAASPVKIGDLREILKGDG